MERHIEKSIQLLQKLEKSNEPYNLGFSGGKDSVVILDLAKKAGVQFNAIYAVTTVDAPGTIDFIKKNYPEVKILHPDITFFQLVAKKGFPSRTRRFCCEFLKEKYGIGKRSIEGMRASEGRKRKAYEPEQCDSRNFMKGAVHILPILEWTEKQVWDYIRENNLPYIKYYDKPYNFNRHGCIGCPLASNKQKRKEFSAFPKYAFAYIRAIKKYIETHPNTMFGKFFENEYEAFYFYVNSDMSVAKMKEKRNSLFKPNYKEIVDNYLGLNQ